MPGWLPTRSRSTGVRSSVSGVLIPPACVARSDGSSCTRWRTTSASATSVLSRSTATSSPNERRTVSVTFPGESAEYRAARDRLLTQEIELRRAMEAVAAARRQLPPGGVVPEDYLFQGVGADGAPTDVKLSELFEPGRDSLVIYSFMFPRDPGDKRSGPRTGQTALLPLEQGPCPSCVALLDQLDGAAEHVGQRANLAVVAKAPLPRILTFAEERGWRRLRFFSSGANTYNR